MGNGQGTRIQDQESRIKNPESSIKNMTIHFTYEKSKVIQALRYHFITRPELRIMIIIVNVFALLSATLAYLLV
jgi:hypothetical protein